MVIKDEILKNLPKFKSVCEVHGVKYLYAFGSSTGENFDPENSDIDLLVEISEADPLERGEKLISLWDTLEKFFNRKVDLLTSSSVTNVHLKNNIDRTKTLIYDGKRAEVLV